MPPFVYIFLGALAIVSALGVILQRNPIHSLLALIGTLLTVAILFIGEDAVVVGVHRGQPLLASRNAAGRFLAMSGCGDANNCSYR